MSGPAGGALPPALYLDTSALAKLVIAEAESAALGRFVAPWSFWTSSVLAEVELVRAVRRSVIPDALASALAAAERLLAQLEFIALGPELRRAAAAMEPATLRSLDAIHLVSALSLGPALGGLVTYDTRLAGAAQQARVTVYAPAD